MQGYGGLRGPDYEDDALDRLLDEIPRATSAPPHLQERIALVSYVEKTIIVTSHLSAKLCIPPFVSCI